MTVTWDVGDDHVLDVLVNETERHNPFSAETIGGLIEAFEFARLSPDVRCVLIRTAGEKVFMSGADLDTVLDGGAEISRLDLFGMFEKLEKLDVPVVCAVQGPALGGGFEFAICCDLVVAAEEAEFGLPETGLGLAPGIAMIRLHQEIGRHLSKELAFTGRRLKAREAASLGLVNRVVSRDRLLKEARALCAEVAERAPVAIRVTKRAINREWGGADWAFVREAMDGIFLTRDCDEGVKAFKEHRRPSFKGQ